MQLGPRQSYQVHAIPEQADPKQLLDRLKKNDKVDILSFNNSEGNYHVSGERIALEELAQEFPEIAESLAVHDANADGFVDQLEVGASGHADPAIHITVSLFRDNT